MQNMCENGGTCRFQAGSFFCDCPPGFSGTVCENGMGKLVISLQMSISVCIIVRCIIILCFHSQL